MDAKVVDKVFSFLVDEEEGTFTKKFDLDKNVKLVRGLLLSSNRPKNLFYRGSQRIEINGEEIFPEGYESKLLMSGLAVAPDEKFRTLGNGMIAGNGEIKMQFKDTHNSNTDWEHYLVILVLQCEMR